MSKDIAVDSNFKKKREKWTLKSLEMRPPQSLEPTRPALEVSMMKDSSSLLLHLVVSGMQGEDAAGLVVQAGVVFVAVALLFVLQMPLFTCPWRHLKLRSEAEGGPEGREMPGIRCHGKQLSFLLKGSCSQLFICPLLMKKLKVSSFCATPPMYLRVLTSLGG